MGAEGATTDDVETTTPTTVDGAAVVVAAGLKCSGLTSRFCFSPEAVDNPLLELEDVVVDDGAVALVAVAVAVTVVVVAVAGGEESDIIPMVPKPPVQYTTAPMITAKPATEPSTLAATAPLLGPFAALCWLPASLFSVGAVVGLSSTAGGLAGIIAGANAGAIAGTRAGATAGPKLANVGAIAG